MIPLVQLYRTSDLPTSGDDGPGDATPVADVSFAFQRKGVYRAQLIVDEPGSYQLVSMGVWNYELVGYPEPIALTVVEPIAPDAPEAGPPWYPIGLTVVAMSGLAVWFGKRPRARA